MLLLSLLFFVIVFCSSYSAGVLVCPACWPRLQPLVHSFLLVYPVCVCLAYNRLMYFTKHCTLLCIVSTCVRLLSPVNFLLSYFFVTLLLAFDCCLSEFLSWTFNGPASAQWSSFTPGIANHFRPPSPPPPPGSAGWKHRLGSPPPLFFSLNLTSTCLAC